MEPPKKIPAFSKSILAGVFTGIIASITAVIYNLLYRSVTDYFSTQIVNFFATVFSSILVITVISLAFYFITKHAEKGSKLFSYLIIALTIASMAAVLFSNAAGKFVFGGGKGLIAGHIFIGGVLAAFLIPYFYRHPRIYI